MTENKEKKVRLTRVEPIKWRFAPPASFPCLMCEVERAEWSVTLKGEETAGRLNLVLCGRCLSKRPEEIWSHFLTPEKPKHPLGGGGATEKS